MMEIQFCGEAGVVAWARKLARKGRKGVRVGIGDDTAVLRPPPGEELLVTTDLFVEGVHFRRGWFAAPAAGRRALCRALSDIAAMGGKPRWVFLSLALPAKPDFVWVKGFLRGFVSAAADYGVALAGGDTGSSGRGSFVADVVVCGNVPPGTAVLRSGARPGDALFVSGRLGATAAAIHAGRPPSEIRPRLSLGAELRRSRQVTSMIDISDGLSTDLRHLCVESGVGAELWAHRLPLAGTLDQALHGGEDYELLFTVKAAQAATVPGKLAGVKLTQIGRVTKRPAIEAIDQVGRRRKLAPAGWEHFASRKRGGR